jgi:hypothetical protein
MNVNDPEFGGKYFTPGLIECKYIQSGNSEGSLSYFWKIIPLLIVRCCSQIDDGK